jgi:hypothetical protein
MNCGLRQHVDCLVYRAGDRDWTVFCCLLRLAGDSAGLYASFELLADQQVRVQTEHSSCDLLILFEKQVAKEVADAEAVYAKWKDRPTRIGMYGDFWTSPSFCCDEEPF